jgi:hypothetical protein
MPGTVVIDAFLSFNFAAILYEISFLVPPTPAHLLGDGLPINRSLEDFLPVRYSILIEACPTACYSAAYLPVYPAVA